ncbi:MAG: adenosylcobalamin-dependent ribonucleoside-diphosphate reductase, partial [Patescibacteria group bacterium]|nr:adenosylcobalamin-dependent ribonucleoside-diphosphate reductase [Patescibacteria group bacterium]
VEIMARGGGVGINLSSLRPRGARVKKVNGFSSGPLNWAELYSVATRDIIQQGGSRRGALMLMLWDWHPDVEEFITVKKDLTRITGANLSVAVSDKFMEAVEKDATWDLVFPDLTDPEYDKYWNGYLPDWVSRGKKVKKYKTIKARKLWDLICEAAWTSAEPGVVFMERYNKQHTNYYFNKINCVNPCGEEGLPPYGVCNLGSLNLAAFVKNGKMDYRALYEHTRIAVRFQDNIIDGDIYIFDGIRKAQLEGERRIGLGTMGLGDALIKMKIRYGSEKSLKVIEKIYKLIRDAAFESSVELAKEKGSFPKFEADKYSKAYFIKKLPPQLRKNIAKYGIRNSLLLMQAPTGSTSLMTGVSSGIEPIFEFSFIRHDRLGEHKLYHPLFEAWKKKHPKDKIPDYYVSSSDLTPEDHVRVQAAIQKYVDASISKTVNAPNKFTIADVKKLYTLAYKLGCKGITFMRDGSRPGVYEKTTKEVKSNTTNGEIKVAGLNIPVKKPRPMVVHGSTYQIETPVGITYITVNYDYDNEPFEVFVTVGKAGSDVGAMADALGRLISLNLRLISPLTPKERVKKITDQLIGIGGARSIGFGEKKVRSLPDAIAKVLANHFGFKYKKGKRRLKPKLVTGNGENKETVSEPQIVSTTQSALPYQESYSTGNVDICPECGLASLAFEEGCKKCYSCGYSEC